MACASARGGDKSDESDEGADMRFVRAVGAMAAFIIGLLSFAGGLVVAAYVLIADGAARLPIDWGTVLGGAIAMLVGVGFLLISRAVGGDNGPVRSYRSRPRKAHSV